MSPFQSIATSYVAENMILVKNLFLFTCYPEEILLLICFPTAAAATIMTGRTIESIMATLPEDAVLGGEFSFSLACHSCSCWILHVHWLHILLPVQRNYAVTISVFHTILADAPIIKQGPRKEVVLMITGGCHDTMRPFNQ